MMWHIHVVDMAWYGGDMVDGDDMANGDMTL
jgi:hypothetical protein